MKKLVVIIFILLFAIYSKAQENQLSRICVKLAPIKVLEPDQCFSAGLEYNLKKEVSVGLQSNYFFNSYAISLFRGIPFNYYRGFSVTPEVRWYNKSGREYTGVNAFAKFVNYGYTYSNKVEVVPSILSYTQLINVDLKRRVFAVHFLYGFTSNKTDKHWSFDYNICVGVRYKVLNGFLPNKELLKPEIWNTDKQKQLQPSLALNFNIKYRLKKS